MRIKEAGKRLQLVRTTYNPESRRGIDKMIASLSSEALEVPLDVRPLLTPEEFEQVDLALVNRQFAKRMESYRAALKTEFVAAGTLTVHALSCPSIVDELTPEEVSNLWSVLERMQRAMKRAKLQRPKER
ncbi:hypothetical protein [Pseudomonas frederiksbergensis]|uniref:hypothetical protein n=1 Tax=Pseudomonas frederiksbergensis TaxID=104087 RepID=UPI003D2277FA